MFFSVSHVKKLGRILWYICNLSSLVTKHEITLVRLTSKIIIGVPPWCARPKYVQATFDHQPGRLAVLTWMIYTVIIMKVCVKVIISNASSGLHYTSHSEQNLSGIDILTIRPLPVTIINVYKRNYTCTLTLRPLRLAVSSTTLNQEAQSWKSKTHDSHKPLRVPQWQFRPPSYGWIKQKYILNHEPRWCIRRVIQRNMISVG